MERGRLRGDSSGSGSDGDDDRVSLASNRRNLAGSGPTGAGQDPSLDSLANDFQTHSLGFGEPPAPPQAANGAERGREAKVLQHHESSSGKRRVDKEYSGRIDKEELIMRQKASDQGSFRVVKGVSRQVSVRRSQGSPGAAAAAQRGLPSDATAQAAAVHAHAPQATSPMNPQATAGKAAQPAGFQTSQQLLEEQLGVSAASAAADAANRASRSFPLQRQGSNGARELKKRLSMIGEIGIKMKNTVLRKNSDKIDGRSAVDRCAAKPRHWTKEEDELLRNSVAIHGEKQWKKIAELVPGRNHTQCLQRWSKVLTPGLKKGQWSVEEDKVLLDLASEQLRECEGKGKKKKVNWGMVKNGIPGRTAKQCRERWVNNLNPEIRRGDWSPEEDETILKLFQVMPQKWAAIAKHLEGRTENAVKIRWKTLTREECGGSDYQSVGPSTPRHVHQIPPMAMQHQQLQHHAASAQYVAPGVGVGPGYGAMSGYGGVPMPMPMGQSQGAIGAHPGMMYNAQHPAHLGYAGQPQGFGGEQDHYGQHQQPVYRQVSAMSEGPVRPQQQPELSYGAGPVEPGRAAQPGVYTPISKQSSSGKPEVLRPSLLAPFVSDDGVESGSGLGASAFGSSLFDVLDIQPPPDGSTYGELAAAGTSQTAATIKQESPSSLPPQRPSLKASFERADNSKTSIGSWRSMASAENVTIWATDQDALVVDALLSGESPPMRSPLQDQVGGYPAAFHQDASGDLLIGLPHGRLQQQQQQHHLQSHFQHLHPQQQHQHMQHPQQQQQQQQQLHF